jgi:hypothetical protein
MSTQNNGCEPTSDHPRLYRIRVQGRLRPDRYDWFEGMTIVSPPPAGHSAITTLSGRLVDQAALMGVLNSLYNLRLTVLSVECLDEEFDQIIAT